MTFLVMEGMRKEFGEVTAVEHLDLCAAKGELVSLLGPSGCGKTTTLRMLAGLEEPTAGRVSLDGADITHLPPNRRNIGMVFQSYALFPNMSVGDNIAFGLRVRGRERSQTKRRVAELLELVDLEDKVRHYPYQLSGGQQQRVALARALAYEPQVLLLDEPLSALDAKIRIALRSEIRSIQREMRITTVYVTHDQEEALSISDRIVVMSQGRVEQVGTPFEIYNSPATSFVATFVGTLNALVARVIDPSSGRLDIGGQEITTTMLVDKAPGETISVAVRPELLSINQVPEGHNRLFGRVEEVTFLGSVVRVRVRTTDGIALNVDTFNHPDLALPTSGDQVTVSFPPDGCLTMVRSDGSVQS